MTMIRLKDVAKRVGVSQMTVSRVLRGAPDISPATQARVHAAARALGYVPDLMARGLRTRRTELVGCVLPRLHDPFWGPAAAAIEAAARARRRDLLLLCSEGDEEIEETALARLLGRRVEGVLLAPVQRPRAAGGIYRHLVEQRAKLVLLGPKPPFLAGFPSVRFADREAVAVGLRHLLELGHRRVAFLAGPTLSPVARERLEGYRETLRRAGIEADDRLVIRAGTSLADGENATRQLLAEERDFTALAAVNDAVAAGALRALTAAGRAVPEQVSLMGLGNHPGAEWAGVPLTTVDPAPAELAHTAARTLFTILDGGRAGDQLLPPRLLRRASTAPPPPETDTAAPASPQPR